ncbi:MAG: Gfo/Idh/MocA family oxidoreductase [Balneolales bacterium]
MKKQYQGTHKRLTRRDFFKNASIGAGGMLLSALPIGASAYAGGSDKIKVALVGCGGRGTGAANQALSTGDDVQLVAMADAFQNRLDNALETLSNRYGDTDQLNVPKEHQFTGFDAYEKAIALADVVILATPPGFRPTHFEAAVEAGKHVFMEKPVATDAPGVRQVIEAGKVAKQKNLNVVLGLQRRYQNNYKEVINRINQGEVGDIVSGQIYWNSAGVWVNERQANQTEMEYQMRNWYYFNWLCGDHIVEQHIHQIDVANWFIGEYPSSAQGMGGREIRKGNEYGEIFDHHFVEYTYPSGAVIASQCRHQPNVMNRVSETFQGTKGTSDTDGGGRGLLRGYNGNVRYEHSSDQDPNPYQQEHNELFAALRKGNVINQAEVGAKATMTAIMGRMATYSGQVIDWDKALNSNINIIPAKLGWNEQPPTLPDENGNYPVPVPGVTEVLQNLSYKG